MKASVSNATSPANLWKNTVGSLVLILAVFGVGAGIAYSKYLMIQAAVNTPPRPEAAEYVDIAKGHDVTFRQSVTSIGTILAPQSIVLKTEVTGTIVSISIRGGEIVKAGDVLVQLDTSVEVAQLASAQAVRKIAESTLQRTSQAASRNAMSQLELEQSQAMVAQSQAEVQRLEAVIRKKTLIAPFSARVGLLDLHPGQYLPDGTVITMLQGIDDYVYVDFEMPQGVADDIAVGDRVTLLVKPEWLQAEIVAIDSQADRITRSVMAQARLNQPPQTLRPNDSVKIQVDYGAKIPGIAIPAAALRRSPTDSIVFLVVPDKTGQLRAKKQVVVPGKSLGNEVVILRGLVDGQQIVSFGSFKIREGGLLKNSNDEEGNLEYQ